MRCYIPARNSSFNCIFFFFFFKRGCRRLGVRRSEAAPPASLVDFFLKHLVAIAGSARRTQLALSPDQVAPSPRFRLPSRSLRRRNHQ